MIDLDRLMVFRAVARAHSFTRAADLVHLTQPGISKHIKHMEEYLGVPLFDRLGRKVALTQAGEILLEATEKVFALVGAAEQRSRDLSGMRAGRLRLAASFPIGIYILPRVVAAFRDAYPAVNLKLQMATSEAIKSEVVANRADIGLVTGQVNDPRLIARQFMSDDLVVIVPRHHKWPSRRQIKAADLLGETFIVAARGAGVRTIIEERLRAKGIVLENVLNFVNSEGVKHAVESGLGISVQPRSIVHREIAAGSLRALALADIDASIRYFFIYLKKRHLSAADEAFVALLLKTTSRTAKKTRKESFAVSTPTVRQ